MNEIYDLRQEMSSVWSQVEQKRLHHSRNNDCVEEVENINQELKDKLHSWQIENQLLREEIENEQKTIETILNQNNELLKFNHYFDQHRMEKKDRCIKSTSTKKKEMTTKKMATNKLQDQIKHTKKKQQNLATVNSIRQLPSEKKKILS